MIDFAVISGMSGAGRTTAADVLEDLGWFVIDNMPVALMPMVGDLARKPDSPNTMVGFVVGSNLDVAELESMLADLAESGARVRVLFLDARSEVLIQRYELSRRRHPTGAGELLSAAIDQERKLLAPIRALADVVVDTSDLNVHQLRDRVTELFQEESSRADMHVTVLSFGFKHGLPRDVDYVFDCRFLPNPHWVEELRPSTGVESDVRDYVLGHEKAHTFMEHVDGLFDVVMPAFVAESKPYLTVALGCTGGRHRSVAIAEELGRRLTERGFSPNVIHRDVGKGE